MMRAAVALRAFRRSDTKERVQRGQRFTGAQGYVEELERLGLVRLTAHVPHAPETKADPSPAVGAKSSASPAVQASPQTTSRKSKRGARRKKAEASSSQTPRSD